MDETVVHDVPEGVVVPEVPGYRVTRWVGQGSTAHVWRARRVEDDVLVALKVLDVAAEEAAVREYAVLAESAVAHAVEVVECLRLEDEGGTRTVLVLEWMAGGSLRGVIRARGYLSAGETVTVITPLATALGELHRLGVVHGDVSTGNVLLDSTGRPAWADLGCSRLVGVDPSEADLWGTEGYVAPEVALGRQPSSESDVYGLGAVAWACLAGSAPGHRATRRDLRDLAPHAPEALVQVVEECLDPDPARRPDVDEVAARVYASAPAEALRMVVPGDVDSSLTRRIREAAAGDLHRHGRGVPEEVPYWEQDVEPEPERRRWWQRRGEPDIDLRQDVVPQPDQAGGSRGGPFAARALGALAPQGASGAHVARGDGPRGGAHAMRAHPRGAHGAGVDRGGTRRWLGVAAAVAGVALLATAAPWDRLAAAEQTAARGPSRLPGTATTQGGAAADSDSRTADALTDPAAARTRPATLLTVLADLRADMLTRRDRDLLAEVTAPGSPAAEADGRLLRRLDAGGYRYSGLDYRVSTVALAADEGDDGVVLRTRIGTGAYVVVGHGRQTRPARSGELVDVRVRLVDGRWRIAEISAP